MAFLDLITELRGAVPKLPIAFCKTLINRAWKDVRESNLWSFNLLEFSWISPPLITAGLVTATQGLATITFDATARAAILAGVTAYSLPTQRQFRQSAAGGIYNILSLDPAFGANGIATLDRIFADTGGAGLAYQVYQLYYVPPVQDFLGLYTVRNPQMYLNLDLTKTREWIDQHDPQRMCFQIPTHVVPWGRDNRGQGTNTPSATLGYPLFEMWGQPITPFSYQCYGIRRGTDLVNPGDTLPVPVGDDLVLAKAYRYAYEWAEANRDSQPRSSGPDFKYLMESKKEEYKKLLTLYRKQDREFINSYFSARDLATGSLAFGFYNTMARTAGTNSPL